MKLQKLMVLAAALVAGTAGAATQTTKFTPANADKKNDKDSALYHNLYHLTRMVIAGSLFGIFGGAAVKGFDKLIPYGWLKIDANKDAGAKNSYLDGYAPKVLVPISGALGVWLYCYFTNKDKACMNDTDEADILAGLPKKDVQSSSDSIPHCTSCACSNC